MSPASPVCIGVDGGASGVRALQVVALPGGGLARGEARSEREFTGAAAFRAVGLDAQRAACARGDLRLEQAERDAGAARIRICAAAIAEAATAAGARRILLGVCLPGLPTADGRGIAVLRNGPRMPAFLADLERELAARGIGLAQAPPPLVGDGVASALGEHLAVDGHLRDVEHALYLGGGTGLSEAVLVRGRALALDELGADKAWSLEFAPGIPYEDALSMGGWMRTRAGAAERAEDAALRGDRAALALLARAAEALASLCALRNDCARARAGVELERAVVGQRLGDLLARPALRSILREPVERALAARGFAPGWLVPSTLRDAPALGAAAVALGRQS